MVRFSIKKKDISPICKGISALAGPFGVYSLKGTALYETSGYKRDDNHETLELRIGNTTIGNISGDPASLETVASILSDYLSNLKEKKDLINHTLNKYREFSFISTINEILNASINIDETLARVTEICKQKLGVENCSIMVRNRANGRLHLKAVSGRVVNEDFWLEAGTGIAGEAIKTGKAIIVNDPRAHNLFHSGGTVTIKNILCIPLRLKEHVAGVMNMSNKISGNFTSEDESLILSISSMIAGAIETSRLLEEKIKDERFATIGQMAAGIIHDIKNPMATIKGFAGLLGDLDFSPEERKQYSDMIVSEVDRLVLMIEDLLTFSRGFKTKYNIERVEAGKYFTGVADFIEKEMANLNIQVELRLDYDGPILIDREKFKRVIFNISGNAREAMHDGGRFLILVQRRGERVEVVFSDSGPGIPDTIMETLFEPFITMGKKKGTGLGLAITKKIVEDMGGSIRAVNGNYTGVPDLGGANFVISLPLGEFRNPTTSEGGEYGPSK